MKAGDVVFFKRARAGLTSAPNHAFREYPGHGYGIMLGHVPKGVEIPPPIELVLRQIGEIGFISFDDIIEMVGQETGDLIAKKFGDKYWGNKAVITGITEDHPKPVLEIVQKFPENIGGTS